jgi:hypothetical protein
VNFKLLTDLGYTVVRWSVDSKGYETQSLDKEMANYKAQVGPSDSVIGGIALEHDVSVNLSSFLVFSLTTDRLSCLSRFTNKLWKS